MKLTWQELSTIHRALSYYAPETCPEDDRIANLLWRIAKKIAKVKAAATAGDTIKAAPTQKEPEE